MPALDAHVKTFIVQQLACFDTPSTVVEAVKNEFGVTVSRQTVESHDPTKHAGRKLAARWVDLFNSARERFKAETANIPIANRAVRLRALNRMVNQAEKMKNLGLAAQLIEQAAKETGGAYTNRQQIEHSGPNGGPIQSADMTPGQFREEAKKLLQEV
ncbi:TPA: DUF2280 domain-containing protein [Stenotrophomonas maltophilia]|uniref:DUF2280 domain-containing protein n=1 Tax=Stenotrophomonas sp. GD03680 TaxID=2975365 RepID=UPI00244A662C|nr:DUF2280 domain-containing protein [Stenotrophomonas sp. GD03680]MDH2023587.1 DUF2280 domain-containing protein [Stenotrophomonas sp. GD03680]HEL3751334.1 DUF2280 domain-containing protein [Stenotrophomonas maltophilia]HEL7728662.1 DUF2280 domain-containing protein [Stenotrophomonas maltophilia]